MKYIIKAYASKTAYPDYYATDDKDITVKFLKDSGWLNIEAREIIKRDSQLEGVLKRCRLGSKAERLNLQAYYNYQA